MATHGRIAPSNRYMPSFWPGFRYPRGVVMLPLGLTHLTTGVFMAVRARVFADAERDGSLLLCQARGAARLDPHALRLIGAAPLFDPHTETAALTLVGTF